MLKINSRIYLTSFCLFWFNALVIITVSVSVNDSS